VNAPGLAAALRRNPRLVRRGAVGAMAVGAVLFIVASFTTPLAGADTGTVDHRRAVAAAAATPVQDLIPSPAPPVTLKRLPAKPVHSKKKAPVTTAVISGLAANGIPSVALNAYRVAAARMANVNSGCGIDWALLAGIGRVESDHGRFGGAQLLADGNTTKKIIGPALDGIHWDYIPAPSNGMELAGDAVYAHALGPMQFIPSTWAAYGADADGNGKADVFNINDAALGAARYLCAAGGNLRAHDGQVAAVLAYNHNDTYLGQVLALADAYRKGIPVTGIPVGNTTGALPPVQNTGVAPPVNPGAPLGGAKPTPSSSKTGAPAKSTPAKTKTPATAPSSGGTPATAPSSGSSPTSGTGGGSTSPQQPTTAPGTSNPPASSAPPGSSPAPTPTRKCLIPNAFDPSRCAVWGS
jgi:membrane-bound lytic murein transglycosylase B